MLSVWTKYHLNYFKFASFGMFKAVSLVWIIYRTICYLGTMLGSSTINLMWLFAIYRTGWYSYHEFNIQSFFVLTICIALYIANLFATFLTCSALLNRRRYVKEMTMLYCEKNFENKYETWRLIGVVKLN